MKNIKNLTTAALIAAFTCVATLISIGPLPPTNGYIHLGDALVVFGGFLLGPVIGGISAAIGSAVADITLGYIAYAPATFIIKFLVAFVAGAIYRFPNKKIFIAVIASVIAEIVMIAGYYVYEAFILGGGIGAIAALGAVPANTFQAVSGVIIGSLLANTFKNNEFLKRGLNK